MMAGMKSLFQKPKWRTWLFVCFVLIFYFTRTRPPDPIQDIALDGRYGFLAAGKDGVIVLDFYSHGENPELLEDPKFVTDFDPSKFVHALEVDDKYVYVANDSEGLLVLSKTALWPDVFPTDDDGEEKKVIIIPTPGDVIDVAIGEKYIYALDSKEGVLVIKMKDLKDLDGDKIPYETFPIVGRGVNIKRFDNQLFVANDENQLLRYSISNPKNLEEQAIFGFESQVNGFTLRGDNLYLATESSGFLIRKNSPTPGGDEDKVGEFTEINPVKDVTLKGNYALVAAGKEGLLVLSVKEPSNIIKIGQEKSVSDANLSFWIDNFVYVADGRDALKTFGLTIEFEYNAEKKDIQQGQYHDVVVEDDIAYIAAGDFGLQVIDVKTSTRPKNLYYSDLPIDKENKDEARALAIYDDSVYVAYKKEGLREFDISEKKENPGKTDNTYSTEGEANDLFIKDHYAYVAVGSAGLQIFDISVKNAKGFVENTPGDASGVFVVDDYAYVADGNQGLQIIQVSDPQKPTRKNSVDTPGTATAVYVAEMKNATGEKRLYAFVADGNEGLFFVDVTDPLGPLTGVSFEINGESDDKFANDLIVRGRTVYLLDQSYGLVTIEIPEDFEPYQRGNLPTPGHAKGLFLEDNLNFVSDGDRGLRIIETEDKDNPVEIGFYDSPKNILKIITDGTNAFLVDGDSGFWVLSLENRNAPYPIAFYRTPGKATDLAINGKFAYIADGKQGVYILNIEEANSPKFAGAYNKVDKAISIAVDGNNVYVGANENEMFILNAEDKKEIEELAVFKTTGTPSQIVAHDGYTYISEGEKGLEVVYVGNPEDLDSFLANEEYGLTDTRFVEVVESDSLVRMDGHEKSGANDIILVADGKNGLKIYDIYRPFKPDFMYGFPMDEGGVARSVSTVDEYAFLSAGPQKLYTFYIWDLNHIRLVGEEASLPETGVIAALSSAVENKEDSNGENRYHNYVYAADEALHTYQVNGKAQSEYLGEYELIGEATLYQIFRQSLIALLRMDTSFMQEKVKDRLEYIGFGLLVFFVVSFTWLLLFSRFVLPIQGAKAWRQAFARLWLSLWGSHGPAVLIKGGKLFSSRSELDRVGRGVARLDFNSAVVLERRSMMSDSLRRYYNKMKEKSRRSGISMPRSRVERPGVIFFQSYERIRGIADLRSQFRIRPGVQAYTRDGIEVNNPVWVLFTLGASPEVLDVTYDGARKPENIRVVQLDDAATITTDNGQKRKGVLVKALLDELDDSDKEEIHLYVQKHFLRKFFSQIKSLTTELDSGADPDEAIDDFVERVQQLITRFEIEDRKRVVIFLDELFGIVNQSKRNGVIDTPMLKWFAYRVGVLADRLAFDNVPTLYHIIFPLKVERYKQEIQSMVFPNDLVDYAKQRLDQFFKQQNRDDVAGTFIENAFRTKLILDREVTRYLGELKDNKVDQIKREELTKFQEKIATITTELPRTDYPFTGLYGHVAKLYDCVKEMNQVASEITISDEWRFPNMKDLFKIREIVRDIQDCLLDQENACLLEFRRYLDLVIIFDFIELAQEKLEQLRLSKSKDEKAENTARFVNLMQKSAKRLDRVEDRALQKQVKKLKELAIDLDKRSYSDFYFFVQRVEDLWQKIKSADILVVQRFLRKSQKQYDQVQKDVRQFSVLVAVGQANGEVQNYKADILNIQKRLEACQIPEKLLITVPPKQTKIGPYIFDRNRILSAVYSEAQDKDRLEEEDERMHWSILPVHVAAQIFRDLVSKEQYDYLYQPGEPNKFNLPKLKANLSRAVRNQGVLAFRYLDHIEGMPLTSGDELEPEKLFYLNNRQLKNPKVLRARGIKVIASGFPDLFPVGLDMPTRQLDNWSAPWERDATIILSQAELQAMRVKNQARSQAQREMAYTLARIMQASGSEEALVIRVFQALEEVAIDKESRQFLPRDTMHMLYRFRRWFLDPNDPKNGDDPDDLELPDRNNSLLG